MQRSYIRNIYPQAVGKMLARSTRVQGIRRGLLTIACKNSIFVIELSQMKKEMMMRINDALHKELIRDIRFVIGNVRPSPPRPKRRKVLTQTQKEWIEQLVHTAPDCFKEEVRSMLTAYKERE